MVPKYRSSNVYTSSLFKPSASRVARSFDSGKLYICLSNKCFKVYPAYLLCDRRKTLTGSPDPTYMQPADKPCIIGGESSL